MWPGIDVTKGYYANNPYPYENTVLYNPKDTSVTEDVITLDGLHYMHDNAAYEDLYQDVLTALQDEPQAIFEALRDQGLKEEDSRQLTRKVVRGKKLKPIDKEYLYPAIDGFLRRQLAPDYLRHIPKGYADKYPMTGKLKTSVDNIQSFMESVVLPEIMVTPSKKIGGKLNYFDYFK